MAKVQVLWVQAKSCHAFIPIPIFEKLADPLNSALCIDNKYYFSCAPAPSHFIYSQPLEGSEAINTVVFLDNSWRSLLESQEKKTYVFDFRWVHNVCLGKQVYVEPVSENDWEILELNAQYIEEHLVEQIRIVFNGECFPFWIQEGLKIDLRVESTSPSEICVKLDSLSEIVVSPKIRRQGYDDSSEEKLCLRVFPLEYIPSIKSTAEKNWTIYISEEEDIDAQQNVVYNLENLHVETRRSESASMKCVLQYLPLIPLGHIAVGKSIRDFLKMDCFVPCLLHRIKKSDSLSPGFINVQKVSSSSPHNLMNVEFVFRESIREYTKKGLVPLTNGMILELVNGDKVHLSFPDKEKECVIFDKLINDEYDISVLDEYYSRSEDMTIEIERVDNLYNPFADVLSKINLVIQESYANNVTSGLLLYGKKGNGKSFLLQHLGQLLGSKSKNPIATVILDCRTLSAKRIIDIQDTFQLFWEKAGLCSPSVLVFENLDAIASEVNEEQRNERPAQISELFMDLFTKYRSSVVTMIATSQTMKSLNALLSKGGIFDHSYQLMPPKKEERIMIIEYYLQRSTITKYSQVSLSEISAKMEGFSPLDIEIVAKKAIQNGFSRHLIMDNATINLELNDNDFEIALSKYNPINLRNVPLQKNDISWNDIGGMEYVKSILLETLKWPTKYSKVFSQCPLRLRSGILLYGYPGCGKTLIAASLAMECNLHFISVKGPELLNKYIGASEQAVRDLFERAVGAKPCLLFFDEFDSVASQRGSDNSGVTDRIVNQLLTEMDGAEGLEGVYVLAATSRPDLIDAALLRPGRLDKSILCDMPEEEERYKILLAVSRKLNIDKDVELKVWGYKCKGYTGADLQALIYNAYLYCVHRAMEDGEKGSTKTSESNSNVKLLFHSSTKDSKATQSMQHLEDLAKQLTLSDCKPNSVEPKAKKELTITQVDLERAFKETQCSLSTSEYYRLKKIYQRFDLGQLKSAESVGIKQTLK